MALKQRGPVFLTGLDADVPAAGEAGRVIFVTDRKIFRIDDGTSFIRAADSVVLLFGMQIAAGDDVERFAEAHGTSNGAALTSAGDGRGQNPAPFAGTIERVWVFVKETGTDTLDQVQVYVSAVSVFDSGAALGLTDGSTFTARPGDSVSEGNVIGVSCIKSGTNAAMDILAGVQIRRD